MKIGKKNLMRLEPAILNGLRLLDLHDQLCLGEHILGRWHDTCASLLVGCVVGEDAGACAGLHHDLLPAGGQLADRTWYQPHAELVALDLSRNTDAHDGLRSPDLLIFNV